MPLFHCLLLLFGCSKDKPTPTDGGDGGAGEGGTTSCVSDGDCHAWQICEAQVCEDGDRNNTVEEAQPILWDEAVEGWLNPAGDRDFYSFTAEGGEFVRINTTHDFAEGNTVLVLRNAAGEVHAWVDDYPTGTAVSTSDSLLYAWLPEGGSWTISVEDAGSYYADGEPVGDPLFSYELLLEEWTGHTQEEDADDAPSYKITMDAADTWIAIGVALEAEGDIDHVQVALDLKNVELRIAGIEALQSYDSGAVPRVRLIDEAGVVLSDKSGVGIDGYAVYPFLNRGTYRLELMDQDGHGGDGEWFYAFAYATAASSEYIDESEPNGGVVHAEEVDLTEAETDNGQIYSYGSRFGTSNEAGDQDWYRVEIPYDSATLIACLSSTWYGSLLTPDLEIHDGEGTLLASEAGDENAYPTVAIDNLTLDAGTYYIVVRSPETASGDLGEWYRFVAYVAPFQAISYSCP